MLTDWILDQEPEEQDDGYAGMWHVTALYQRTPFDARRSYITVERAYHSREEAVTATKTMFRGAYPEIRRCPNGDDCSICAGAESSEDAMAGFRDAAWSSLVNRMYQLDELVRVAGEVWPEGSDDCKEFHALIAGWTDKFRIAYAKIDRSPF